MAMKTLSRRLLTWPTHGMLCKGGPQKGTLPSRLSHAIHEKVACLQGLASFSRNAECRTLDDKQRKADGKQGRRSTRTSCSLVD